MKAARLVVFGVAISAGGVAAWLAANRSPETVVEAAPTIEVLVAKADLSPGLVIGDQNIGWQDWPKATANPSLIEKTKRPDAVRQYIGAVVRVSVTAGDPFRDKMVSVLKEGTHAVSIDLSPESDNESTFAPDQHVDLLVQSHDKQREKTTGFERFTSDEILDNLRVLAVVADKSVMVEMTPEQADTLTRSHQLGTILVVHHAEGPPGPINVVRFGVSTSAPR